MKKLLSLIILGVILTTSLMGCQPKKDPLNETALTSTTADMTGYESMAGVTETQFELITLHESLRLYNEGLSGIVYYGYVGCPYCNQVVPVLNAAATEAELKIYYVNMKNADGNTEDDYNATIEALQSILTEEDGKYSFYVPEVVVVRNGEIVADHLSVLEDYNINDGNMTEDQVNQLQEIYNKMFKQLQ